MGMAMAMEEVQMSKPKTQKIEVPEFDAFKPGFSEDEKQSINWARITSLPAFQMFLEEAKGIKIGHGKQLTQTVETFTREAINGGGEESLFNEYANWHKAKGYWPNETPMGELIEAEA